jgi:hypothetical protein
MEKIIIKENIIKNIFIVILLIILYFPISSYLTNSNLFTDLSLAGNILVATSIIAVTACFGNFAFTYEKISVESIFERYLAHFVTGLLMLIIGTSLIFTGILVSFVMGHFILLDFLLIVLYIACVGYDFWDLFRAL